MEIVDQRAMNRLFAVTDELELDREEIQVPLGREGEGAVRRLPAGRWEITLPAGEDALEAFLAALPERLRQADRETSEE